MMRLRPIEARDAERLWEAVQDPEGTRLTGTTAVFTRAQIQAAPTTPTRPVVIARRRALTPATAALGRPPRAHVRDDHLVVVFELDVLDDGAVIDTQQLPPYPDTAHAASCALVADLRSAGNVGQRRRVAMEAVSARPRIVQKSRN
jgi:hypothetical protein